MFLVELLSRDWTFHVSSNVKDVCAWILQILPHPISIITHNVKDDVLIKEGWLNLASRLHWNVLVAVVYCWQCFDPQKKFFWNFPNFCLKFFNYLSERKIGINSTDVFIAVTNCYFSILQRFISWGGKLGRWANKLMGPRFESLHGQKESFCSCKFLDWDLWSLFVRERLWVWSFYLTV